ncbi:DUF4271 domain-containing protein [Tenacibaculum sp. UWU-22]|uniref:DUF4271 domain-containing protein n=1 Tax=Tenacibaculum sp. UWU-22 TaxID=3234187 RepID=UPI0034DB6237
MQAIEREIISNNWITLLLLFALLLLAYTKALQPSKFYRYMFSFFLTGFIEKRMEEKPSIFSPLSVLQLLFSAICLSLFLFLMTNPINESLSFVSFLIFSLLFFTYFLLRGIIDFSLAKLYGVFNNFRYFLFSKYNYVYTLSLLLFPFIIVYVYGFKNRIFLASAFVILFLIRFFLVFSNNKKMILNYFFYFILYLCALEIAPLLIIYKVAYK